MNVVIYMITPRACARGKVIGRVVVGARGKVIGHVVKVVVVVHKKLPDLGI